MSRFCGFKMLKRNIITLLLTNGLIWQQWCWPKSCLKLLELSGCLWLIPKLLISHNQIETSNTMGSELKLLPQSLFRDVTTRKIQVRPCQWWAESAPLGRNRVKVSENLGVTAVAPVAPLVTSLLSYCLASVS